MRLTVLGCGPASPQPDTPASGLLVESGSTAVLLDCGQGVAARLVQHLEPDRLSAVVIGHMHADHFIDLAALRYRFAWGGRSASRLPVHLPPGGLEPFSELAGIVSERAGFFDDAFDVREYEPATRLRIGELTLDFIAGRHYVRAWGVAVTGPDGSRLVYAGDTGPSQAMIAAATDADLLVCEATLDEVAEDDPETRGHLTLDEALAHACEARARRLVVTHFPSSRREAMAARIAPFGPAVTLARPDLVIDVGPGTAGESLGAIFHPGVPGSLRLTPAAPSPDPLGRAPLHRGPLEPASRTPRPPDPH